MEIAGTDIPQGLDADAMDAGERVDSPDERLRALLVDAVRTHPFLSMIAASGVGVTLGGLVFSRLGRLVFLAAAGYAATELWRREGMLDTKEILASLTRSEPGPEREPEPKHS
jgi:hypothetical protein